MLSLPGAVFLPYAIAPPCSFLLKHQRLPPQMDRPSSSTPCSASSLASTTLASPPVRRPLRPLHRQLQYPTRLATHHWHRGYTCSCRTAQGTSWPARPCPDPSPASPPATDPCVRSVRSDPHALPPDGAPSHARSDGAPSRLALASPQLARNLDSGAYLGVPEIRLGTLETPDHQASYAGVAAGEK